MVLVYVEINKGKVKKSSLECVNYARHVADSTGSTVIALANAVSADVVDSIGKAGAHKVLLTNDEKMHSDIFIAHALEKAMQHSGAKTLIMAFDLTGKTVAPWLSGKLKASLVSGAVDYPAVNGAVFEVRKNVFSGKASALCAMNSEIKIITVLPNSHAVSMSDNKAETENFAIDFLAVKNKITVKEKISTNTGAMLPLPEAELVVSAGRGMKGPENWGMIEELASSIGATTACSRPVADMHWRPHHEHVGQTGIAIRPNLYIAIGISGAIQHLAGVNGSKTIVVINNDKEAPFFKSADYGVVGDAFAIVPKLNAAIKKFKANHN